MKVVLLAGGLGTRMREETEFRPKPMVEVGGEPLLWHLMRIFARHGLADFVVCAGYKGEMIDSYFSHAHWVRKSRELQRLHPPHGVPEPEWRIQVVDTGAETPTGGRLKKVESELTGDRFICTYGDGLAPVNVCALLDAHRRAATSATVTLSRPTSRFGVAELDRRGMVTGFREKPVLDELVSIGFFVFEAHLLSQLTETSVLEESFLTGLAYRNKLAGFVHDGYWQPIDTYRELLAAKDLWDSGDPPWVTS